MSGTDSLSNLLEKLSVPPDFLQYESMDNYTTQLELWKEKSIPLLQDIQRTVVSDEALSLNTRADLIFSLGPFSSEGLFDTLRLPWVTPQSQKLAQEILASDKLSPNEELSTHVLAYSLKPIFKSNPHPYLQSTTGRKILRPAGGSMAMQDFYEEQAWKKYPGVYKVVLWCIIGIESYETVWHLMIPPIMAFLDDYEVRYKLQGAILVQQLVQHAPGHLLRRTGIDGLFQQSLRTCLSNIDAPESPELIKRAICASVSLALLTKPFNIGTKPSPAYFDDLTNLLGEGVINGIWLYSNDKPEIVKATFDALPPVLKALGIGAVRFLKPLIPQLAHSLIPRVLIPADRKLQLSAINILNILLDICKPRINAWKETILDAIARCWVGLVEEEGFVLPAFQTGDRNQVKACLQHLCARLVSVCPSIAQEEMQRFVSKDQALFQDLFINVVIPS